MRVSRYYKLGREQATLDFVDVDISGDTRVFISPRALQELPSEWGDQCVSLIQNFFQTVLQHVRAGRNRAAEDLLRMLREPNETHLGLSSGKARGRALGTGSAHVVWSALSNSEAAKSGLLEDLEDTILMIEGISVDIISDITTNIIREPLINYTAEVAGLYGIALKQQVDSGPLWNPTLHRWESQYVELPITSAGRLLLVPKAIVRRHLLYDADEYYRYYLLDFLQQQELNANSELVQLIRDRRGRIVRRRVTKKSVRQKYGEGKAAIVRETLRHPEVLERYRQAKRRERHAPLTNEDLADVENQNPPAWQKLLADVMKCKPGNDDAVAFETAIEGLLSALFYPMLTNPKFQHEIHQGRKRIDITYTNMGKAGFFHWIATNYPAAQVFVECKNYGREIGNPELDQLTGRFSPSRGKFGLLVCRSLHDRALFEQRCLDTARDDRGFVICLDDNDLRALVESQIANPVIFPNLPILQRRFDALINS